MASNGPAKTSTSYSTGYVTTSTSTSRDNDSTSDTFDLRDDHVTTVRRACQVSSDDIASIDRQLRDICYEGRNGIIVLRSPKCSFRHRHYCPTGAHQNGEVCTVVPVFVAPVFMSVVWQNGKLSVAYYDIDVMEIYMMLDCEETTELCILRRVLEQVQPSLLVISTKQEQCVLQNLYSAVSEILIDEEVFQMKNIIKVLPSLDFSFDSCKRRIFGLSLPTIPDHFLDTERSLYLSSVVPFENICLVRATGGLLRYLEKVRAGVELEDISVRVPVFGLQVFSLEEEMIIDQTALSSLQIFQKEYHPSVYMSGQGNSAKEGLSLFGVLNRCKTQIGSRTMRQWFLHPLKKAEDLRQRHAAVAFFVNPRNIEVTTNLQDCVKKIKAIPKILSRMERAQATHRDWQSLHKTVYNAILIADLCRAQPQNISIFSKIGHSFKAELMRIATLITKIVDFDESALQNRFIVNSGIDSDLDEKKRTYNGLPHFMTKVAKEELDKLPSDIPECNILYLPQLGYLLTIPHTERLTAEDDFAIPGLEFVFLANKTLHYKTNSTKELDNMLGDVQCEITDHETCIMHRLQYTVLDHTNALMAVMHNMGELDCLLSLATCAQEFSYIQPELTEDGIMHIVSGRHPLQEMCCSPFVPNDIHSGSDSSCVKILTGPNSSGKSVYVKQVALIAFMAHIGSFVPAQRAQICMLDRIFTRIKSLESVTLGLSTYMIDLNQMSDAVRSSTKNSLVVIDEFGKGTGTVDGKSLLCACINYCLSMGIGCPHIFLCTHFNGLQNFIVDTPDAKVCFQTMESVYNDDELVFLYQLIDGHTDTSYACYVASQAGLPPVIVTRASEVSNLLKEGKRPCRVDSINTEAHMKRCSVIVNKFLDMDLETGDLHSTLKSFVFPSS